MYILRSYIPQIYAVDTRAEIQIERHTRRRHYITYRQIGPPGKFGAIKRPARAPAAAVYLAKPLLNLEKPRTAPDAHCLKRRRHRQTDGLVRARRISHHEACVERIEPALHAFHRSIETLQVDGYILSLQFCHKGGGGTYGISPPSVQRFKFSKIPPTPQ